MDIAGESLETAPQDLQTRYGTSTGQYGTALSVLADPGKPAPTDRQSQYGAVRDSKRVGSLSCPDPSALSVFTNLKRELADHRHHFASEDEKKNLHLSPGVTCNVDKLAINQMLPESPLVQNQRKERRAASKRAYRERKKHRDPTFLKREAQRVAQYRQNQGQNKKHQRPKTEKQQTEVSDKPKQMPEWLNY